MGLKKKIGNWSCNLGHTRFVISFITWPSFFSTWLHFWYRPHIYKVFCMFLPDSPKVAYFTPFLVRNMSCCIIFCKKKKKTDETKITLKNSSVFSQNTRIFTENISVYSTNHFTFFISSFRNLYFFWREPMSFLEDWPLGSPVNPSMRTS